MQINNILLTNFRNYSNQKVEFGKQLNVIIGKNAQGKTNLLESVFLCAIGRSPRLHKDKDLINWDKDFSVQDIAKKCCISESTLYHLFQKNLGQTPVRFINSIRINIAIEYLENSNYSISKIGELVGFHSENHFRKMFFDFTGTTPLKFRKSK